MSFLTSLGDASSAAVAPDKLLLAAGYMAMLVYAMIMLGRISLVENRYKSNMSTTLF